MAATPGPGPPVRFTIFYRWGRVDGQGPEAWALAPSDGVQVVRVPEPYPDHPDGQPCRPWVGVSDRQLWTGEDAYDPFGWGVKEGSEIPDEEYWPIWKEAAYGDL